MTGNPLEPIINACRGAVGEVLQSHEFTAFETEEKSWQDGDIVVFNNSVVYRDAVKTRKSNLFLGVSRTSGTFSPDACAVYTPKSLNVDFKRIQAKSKAAPQPMALDSAVKNQVDGLGKLVFVLIGDLDNNCTSSMDVEHVVVKKLTYNPLAAAVSVASAGSDAEIICNTLLDGESVWQALQDNDHWRGIAANDRIPDDLEETFIGCYEKLQLEACAQVRLPTAGLGSTGTLLGAIRKSVNDNTETYKTALALVRANPNNAEATNDLLRTAYNLASDAPRIIALLVSICDLKPILQWCTSSKQLGLARAFKELPWVKSKKKPNLQRYREIISGARNKAFHNLIPFDRSIEVDLTGVSIEATSLKLFPAYAKRQEAQALDYKDREVVEVLAQFTRAPETLVPVEFWERNGHVMTELEALLTKSEECLFQLWKARYGG